MRISFVILASLFSLGAFAAEVEDRWLDQPLDHRNVTSPKFKQHVQILIPQGVDKTAPVIFHLSGELGQSAEGLKTIQKFYGRNYKAIYIQAAHRGYGSYSDDADQSLPAYVNVDQAVEDFHQVIGALKSEFTGPWVALGYSYTGGLAVELAARYPQDVRVVVSSSGVMQWPFSFNGHDDAIRMNFPAGMHAKLSERIALLKPGQTFDQNWLDRIFLQTAFMGIAQYQKYFLLVDLLRNKENASNAELIAELHKIDQGYANSLLSNWAGGHSKGTLTLDEAKTGKFHSRYWVYQQCREIGGFYGSRASNKIWPQSDDEYRDYCDLMFGVRPEFQKLWDFRERLSALTVPVIFVAGRRDPWLPLQIGAKDLVLGDFMFARDGFHCPDRDIPPLADILMERIFHYLP